MILLLYQHFDCHAIALWSW